MRDKKTILKDFREIPGIGVTCAEDLYNIGLRSLDDLKNADPEKLYQKLCIFQNCKVDRCMLYVLRCAVYYASHTKHDPELLKWWNWKDRTKN